LTSFDGYFISVGADDAGRTERIGAERLRDLVEDENISESRRGERIRRTDLNLDIRETKIPEPIKTKK